MSNIRSASGFIHPFHFNKNHIVGCMIEKGVVVVEGTRYILSDCNYYTSEPVHLFLRQDIYESESEYNERLRREEERKEQIELERKKWLEEQEKREAERLAREQQELQDFKNRYNMPFKYSVRIKPVLSGLSENSNGDGAKRNTVLHLFVEEELEGRLKRAADTFLCSPKNDGKWFYLDNNAIEYDKVVTCKRCLELMKRWMV